MFDAPMRDASLLHQSRANGYKQVRVLVVRCAGEACERPCGSVRGIMYNTPRRANSVSSSVCMTALCGALAPHAMECEVLVVATRPCVTPLYRAACTATGPSSTVILHPRGYPLSTQTK